MNMYVIEIPTIKDGRIVCAHKMQQKTRYIQVDNTLITKIASVITASG